MYRVKNQSLGRECDSSGETVGRGFAPAHTHISLSKSLYFLWEHKKAKFLISSSKKDAC
jgi:hypothetical protein